MFSNFQEMQLMTLYNKLLTYIFPTILLNDEFGEKAHFLDPIRERITTTLVRLTMVWGVPTILIATLPAIQHGLIGQLAAGYVCFIIIFFFALDRTISYKVRAIILMTMAFAFIVAAMFDGINEMTSSTLFTFVVMVTLMLGFRAGMVAALIGIGTVFMMQWLFLIDLLEFNLYLVAIDDNIFGVVAFAAFWLFFVGNFILTISVYFDEFAKMLAREETALKMVEGERDILVKTLNREKELSDKLEVAYLQTEEMNHIRSKMITMITHEFRTPITSIKTSATLLTEHLERLNLDKRKRIQGRIDNSIDYMTMLLQDIELIERQDIDILEVNKSKLLLSDFCEQIQIFIDEQFADLPIEFRYPQGTDIILYADVKLLERIVIQLLTNAVKFSNSETAVSLTMSFDSELRIGVKDKGIGIPKNEIGLIWEPFYRAENAQNYRGLGLGLTIIAYIVKRLEGEITAVSPGIDQGATFQVTLTSGVQDEPTLERA